MQPLTVIEVGGLLPSTLSIANVKRMDAAYAKVLMRLYPHQVSSDLVAVNVWESNDPVAALIRVHYLLKGQLFEFPGNQSGYCSLLSRTGVYFQEKGIPVIQTVWDGSVFQGYLLYPNTQRARRVKQFIPA